MKKKNVLKYPSVSPIPVLRQAAPVAAAILLSAPFTAYAATGWQQDASSNWTYVVDDKKQVNQWVPWTDGTLRYVGGNGLIVTNNWVSYQGGRYRVKEDGSRYENEWFSITSTPTLPSSKPSTTWYYAGADGKIYTNGWYNIGGREYYFYGGGNSPRGSFFNLDDKRYYVDENGARANPGWLSINGVNSAGTEYTNWYYVQSDGSLLRGGWHELDGQMRYFDANGLNYRNRWFNLEDNRYYADGDGNFATGWFSISGVNSAGTEYTNWYYADTNRSVWRGGWAQIGDQWYYFDPNGLNYRKRWYVDGNGERYYLDENGVLQDDGWFKIENTNATTGVTTQSWYYAQDSGAVLKGGFKDIGEERYYFDNNGYNYRNRWVTYESGDRRYLGEDGALCRDEWFVIKGIDSRDAEYHNWYYAGSDGDVYMDGWYKIDGKSYCFNTSGVMRTGWFSETDDEEEDAETSYYYCGEDGARATGWQYLEIPESWAEDDEDVQDYIDDHGQYAWFYFNKTSGKKKRSSGGKKEMNVEGKTYCIDDDGIVHYGWVKLSTTTPEIRGYKYFYEPESENDQTLVLGEEAESIWLEIEGPDDLSSGTREWYYFDNNGRPAYADENSYEVREIRGKKYVFDMYGAAQYGLVEVDGEFYYCGEADGDRSCRTGKVSIDDGIDSGRSTYYFDSNGKGVTGNKDGYLYYKGKRQEADSASKYEVFDIPGVGKRLVNSSGKIMRNTTVTDGNDQKWELGSGGRIEVYGSDEVAEVAAPEATTSY